ncbi:hypothetical protein Z949_1571 [Sulfitobacter guttiformis KCTC 32187]|nr:hypothetical protein Z949_1571 [Sulfitobacter guttiformis KCTC 32187]
MHSAMLILRISGSKVFDWAFRTFHSIGAMVYAKSITN